MVYSNLTEEEKLISFRQQLLPSLKYPLTCTNLTKSELRSVQYPALNEVCGAKGVNQTFPRCVLFGDYMYQGVNMEDLYVIQNKEKVEYYIGHLRIKE